jgi:2-isopropylmalate synthase
MIVVTATDFLQFMTSRPNTPLLLRGKHGASLSQDLDLNGSPKSPKTNRLSIPKPNGVPTSGPDAISILEAKANGM